MLGEQAKTPRSLLGLEIIRSCGGVDELARNLDGDATRRALQLLIMNEAEECGPLPDDVRGTDNDRYTAFMARVCSKLRCDLRQLGELTVSEETKAAYLLRSVRKNCRSVRVEYSRRHTIEPATTTDSGFVENAAAPSEPLAAEAEPLPAWWEAVRRRLPSPLARLGVMLASFVGDHDNLDAIFRSNGRVDVGRLAALLRCSRSDVEKVLAALRKEVVKVRQSVPRPFLAIHRELSQLATTSFAGLADCELRQKLFEISRGLAYSFGPDDAIARGARRLDRAVFSQAIDMLLDEREFSPEPEPRTVLERLMQSIVRVREAFEKADIDAAFTYSAMLVLDAARVQHHVGAPRLQVLMAYTYFLWLGGWYDAFIRANQAIADRCDALIRQKGEEFLDAAPEFEGAETLRRVRTFAILNQISCEFHHTVTSARRERFVVRDYDALAHLARRLETLLEQDPEAGTVIDELLVVRAHLARAAYNFHRTASEAEKNRWKEERERQRESLHQHVRQHFFDHLLGAPDVPRLLAAANTAEGSAVDRTLDILQDLLQHYPAAARDLRAERLAALRSPTIE